MEQLHLAEGQEDDNNVDQSVDVNAPNGNTAGMSTNSSDLDVIFDEYQYVPRDLKQRLMNLGVTLEKLLAMKRENILGLSQVDPSMTADLMLFVQAFDEYKKERQIESESHNLDNFNERDSINPTVVSNGNNKSKKDEKHENSFGDEVPAVLDQGTA